MKYTKCLQCGKDLSSRQSNRGFRFCSHSCANTNSAPKRTVGKMAERICIVCGKKMQFLESVIRVRERSGRKIKYCSRACSNEGARTGKEIPCPVCGEMFYTTRRKYCSTKCMGVAKTNNYKGKKSGSWYENGYKVLYIDGRESIKEHIYIMEKSLGRKLDHKEVVHHKNEIKDDNSIDNLQLMTRSEHSEYHRKKEHHNGEKLFKPINERYEISF